MKHVIIAIIIALLLSACTAQPTPTQAPTATPLPPTATPQPTPTSTEVPFEDLPYEQQKTMIESRFEQGSQAFEALIKEDGNLEYYDGTWKTLEAMRNLNGEIIPWGESYDMISEEGRSGILTNIMAGNEAVMEKHINSSIDLSKKNAEKKGFNSSNFNTLYVQFFPDADSLANKNLSNIGYYEMQGQIVLKNASNKIYVINLETSFNNTMVITYVKSGNTLAENPSELYDQKAFDDSFLGIDSADLLNYMFRDLIPFIASGNVPAEQAYLETVLNSNMENFLRKIASDPNSISKDLYNIRFIIHPNY